VKRTVAAIALGGFAVLAGAVPAGAAELSVPAINLAAPGYVPVTVTDIAGVSPADLKIRGVAPALPRISTSSS
jgi:hypothetical protein